MTKIILHGGYTSDKNDLNKGFFLEMINSIPDKGTILLVYFASLEEDVDEKYRKEIKIIQDLSGDRNIKIMKASEDKFMEQVRNSDVVYFRGGYTEKLIRAMEKYPEFVDTIKGKTLAGSSAGAYMLSAYYFSNSQSKVIKSLGYVPVKVACHFQSKKHLTPKNIDPVLELEKYASELETVVLRDCEWRVFNI